MIPGTLKFKALQFFARKDKSLFVNVYHNVSPCFRKAQKQLICCACEESRTLIEKVKLVKAKNWHKLALGVENLERKAILPV